MYKQGRGNSGYRMNNGAQERVFVSSVTVTVADAATNYDLWLAAATEGEVAIFNADTLTRLTTEAALGTSIFVAQKTKSDPNTGKPNNLKTNNFALATGIVRQQSYAIDKRNIIYFGYSGVAGTSLNTPTLVKGMEFGLGRKELLGVGIHQASYDYSRVIGTDVDVYNNLVALVDHINDEVNPINKERRFSATIINSGSGAILYSVPGTTPATFAVTKGSKVLTITVNDSTTTTLAAGDYIRISNSITEGSGFNTAAALVTVADPVYKVVSITGTTTLTVTLDRVFEGESQTAQTTVAATSKIHKVTIAATGWGLRLVALDKNVDYTTFRIGVFEDADLKEAQAMQLGSGVPYHVEIREEAGQVRSGYTTRYIDSILSVGLPEPAKYTSSTQTYHTFTINPIKVGKSLAGPMAQDVHDRQNITLFIPITGATTLRDQLATVLGLAIAS